MRRPATDPVVCELVTMAAALLAVVLPFANGMLAGRPGPTSSLDLRYALVLGGAALGLLATVAWRASTFADFGRRARTVLAALAVIPIMLALGAPRDPLWTSLLTLGVVLGAPIVLLGATYRMARAPGPRRGLRIAAAIVTVLALVGPWTTMTWGLVATQLMIAPVRLAHQNPSHQAGDEEVELVAADGLVVRGTFKQGRAGSPAVVLLHGRADGRVRMGGWASLVATERGYHTLRIDWRAHGRSEGSVMTFADRERLDLDAAFDWLDAREDVDPDKRVIIGASMGAGVALASTARLVPRGLRGIVAFAPPSDYSVLIEETLAPFGPLAPMVRTMMSGVSRGLGQISPLDLAPGRELERGPPVPVLLFHGDADRTVPLALSERLAERIPTVELRVMPGVGHDEIPAAVLDDPASRTRVLQFLRYPRARD